MLIPQSCNDDLPHNRTFAYSKSIFNNGSLAFFIVVIVSYFFIFTSSKISYGPTQILLLLGLGLVYTVLGMLGFDYCDRTKSLWAIAGYFLIQTVLSTVIAAVVIDAQGYWLLTLPLVAHSFILLPGIWKVVNCVILLAAFGLPVWLYKNDLGAGLLASFSYLPGVIFTAVFAQIAVKAEHSRQEVQILADELAAANAKLRSYAVQVEELATTKERNRVAREIHDSLGHYLTVVNMQLEAARSVLPTDQGRALDALGKAQSMTKEGLAEIRRSVASLRSLPVETRSLPEAVASLVEETRVTGIVTELKVLGEPRTLGPQAELTLFRAAQEGLTNARKYAMASRVDLALDYAVPGKVRLRVHDNGVGAKETKGGFGLLGIQERVQLLSGSTQVRTAPGQGLTLEVELPG